VPSTQTWQKSHWIKLYKVQTSSSVKIQP